MSLEPADPAPRVPVALEVSPGSVDLVADRLFRAGASAVSESLRPDGLVTLTADLAASQIDQVRSDLADGGSGTEDAGRLRVLEPDAAWNDGWREFARTWRCGDRIVLRPAWLAAELAADLAADDGAIEVVVEPGEAFGSGSHVTTRLCVEAVGRLVVGGEHVLDVGCGTGVLGVAALLLGAGSVMAVDIDPEAVRVTRVVADLNGVSDRLRVSVTPVDELSGQFDLVLANLLIPIIEEVGAVLADRTADGGHLVVGGVLRSQQERVESAVAPLPLVRVDETDGWLSLVFRCGAPSGLG